MSELSTYNGYSNYVTWNIVLWLQNDPGLYAVARGMCAVEIKEFVLEGAHEAMPEAGMFTDILAWALSHADWTEIEGAMRE